ncbi:hypothetical protein Dip510_001866 [Elusimicrobium posterum]|uniref:hypothetical protein n=1 Tax=Elusimicrobium posterum TaxID=3116653 RepID=UPI003C75E29E
MNPLNMFIKTKITVLKKKESKIIFRVENGKGVLREKYCFKDEQSISSLIFKDIPLTKFYGDNYLCPTCTKLVAAGYGLNKTQTEELDEFFEKINEPFINIETSFELLKPVLGLLKSGHYMISDEELIPTDGDERFFWSINNTPKENPASALFINYDMAEEKPIYLLPTQPPSVYDPQRVEHYKNITSTRALAYQLNGTLLCALLDGHHKAVAAAVKGEKVRTLVISAPSFYTPQGGDKKPSINFHELSLEVDEDINKIIGKECNNRGSAAEYDKYKEMKDISFDSYNWPQELLKTAKNYPPVEVMVSIERAGDISDKRLDNILSAAEQPDKETLFEITAALYATKNPRFAQFAIFICSDINHVLLWRDIFPLLVTIKTKEVEDFFIDFTVNDEGTRPEISELVNEYFKNKN